MAQVVYGGPHADVDVPAFGIEGAVRGEPVEVDDKAAKVLLASEDWTAFESKGARAPKDGDK